MPILIEPDYENNGPRCTCEVYQHCKICDPEHFAQHKEERPHQRNDEQREAAIKDVVMSRLTEFLASLGVEFTESSEVDGDGTLVVTVNAVLPVGIASAINHIRFDLKV